MKFHVKNFTESDHVGIEGYAQEFEGKHSPTPIVMLSHYAGSLSMHHAMRPDQARFMATALAMAADEAEQKAQSNVVEAAA